MVRTRYSAVLALAALGAASFCAVTAAGTPRAAAPAGSIQHILVIDLENEGFSTTFGASSPAVYLNSTLVPQGELIVNYFATSHVSLGNYLAQVSGQSPTPSINNDCLNLASLRNPPPVGSFNDISPGTDATDQASFPGQVVGNGCVFPGPHAGSAGARTIGNQLDDLANSQGNQDGNAQGSGLSWRMYAEDMGNDPVRDGGSADPLGGTDCAHPALGGSDPTNGAAPTDQYATRHNPFVYFRSVIDDTARCNARVVPLGTVVVGSNGAPDIFSGHLFNDLRSADATPQFMFVSPNLCNDGHDATCAGPNVEGTVNAAGKNIGGLAAADLWLKHWMPMILASPAYRNGSMLVVITFDESSIFDSRACPKAAQSDCHSPTGPNVSNPGFSTLLALFGVQHTPTTNYVYPGGGQIGAVLLNSQLIKPGTVNTTGSYNHYSALRSYEDLLGITWGGDDGLGHLGYAAVPGLTPFGRDVFNNVSQNNNNQN